LRHLDHALAKMESSRRAQLVEEIEQHVADLRATNPAHTRAELNNLLDRVGRPDDIAAAALEDEDGTSTSGIRRRTTMIVGLAVVVVILVSLGIAEAVSHRASTTPRSATTHQSATTPRSATTHQSKGHVPPPTRIVSMPDVIGATLAQAQVELQSLGLQAGRTQQVVSQSTPPGIVVSEAPAAGSRVATGSESLLTVSSGPAGPSDTPTSVSPVVSELPSGIYIDGGSGTPHYYVTLTSQADGTISGSVSFLSQDGQTSAVFSFSGSTNSGTATLTRSTGGGPVSVTYSAKTMQFGECTQYLKLAQSLSQCTFTYSPGGALQ
jgi:hypothetical protein